MNELGILTEIDTICTVSGGSIVAAQLVKQATQWPATGTPIGDWEQTVAGPFRRFTNRNIRTWPIVKRFLPWNWRDGATVVEALATQYERRLIRMTFGELPARPRFIFCATDMTFGVNFVFDTEVTGSRRGRLGDYQAGYVRPIPNCPVARAIAASSCFPPIGPLPVNLEPSRFTGGSYRGPDRDALVAAIRLSDGGVYDNAGLEPVWKDHRVVLVSDGGKVLEDEADRGLLWRLNRYTMILESQSRRLRKRWLISGFLNGTLRGTYWGIGSATSHYNPPTPGYSNQIVNDIISEVRTDLDAFSTAEIAVLENHGYLMADAAIQRHLPDLITAPAAALTIPHPAWMDEDRVRQALAQSHKRTALGRF
ncbi:MAG: patatin-like phospholipase family protein [Chloroflexota bacterium]|nr:patatin-like phospholipase family protein [Chloroflexota bacterium]